MAFQPPSLIEPGVSSPTRNGFGGGRGGRSRAARRSRAAGRRARAKKRANKKQLVSWARILRVASWRGQWYTERAVQWQEESESATALRLKEEHMDDIERNNDGRVRRRRRADRADDHRERHPAAQPGHAAGSQGHSDRKRSTPRWTVSTTRWRISSSSRPVSSRAERHFTSRRTHEIAHVPRRQPSWSASRRPPSPTVRRVHRVGQGPHSS